MVAQIQEACASWNNIGQITLAAREEVTTVVQMGRKKKPNVHVAIPEDLVNWPYEQDVDIPILASAMIFSGILIKMTEGVQMYNLIPAEDDEARYQLCLNITINVYKYVPNVPAYSRELAKKWAEHKCPQLCLNFMSQAKEVTDKLPETFRHFVPIIVGLHALHKDNRNIVAETLQSISELETDAYEEMRAYKVLFN